MNPRAFAETYRWMTANIEELQQIMKKRDKAKPLETAMIEKIKYLFYGVVRNLVTIGGGIMQDHNFRPARNNADVFICLAENGILLPSVVPGVKRAVLAMPRLAVCPYDEALAIVEFSLHDIQKCLDSFSVYYSTPTSPSP